MKTKVNNFAGIFRIWKSVCFILVALLVMSCAEDKIGQPATDGKAPDRLKEATAVGLPGGALITYVLPDNDTDISYVKGEYKIGDEVRTVRASVYKNFFLIEGLESNLSVNVDLYVVDHSENLSDPLKTSFVTQDAPYATIGNSIKFSPAIGGIYFRWDNPENIPDIGAVLMMWDSIANKLKEYKISFSTTGVEFVPFDDTVTRHFGAYVIDKWGHYSKTIEAWVAAAPEIWLDRTKMSGHPIGNDAPLMTPTHTNPNPAQDYYSGPERLFDGIARGLITDGNYGILSSSAFGITSPDGYMPIYYTIDLGIEADISRFWIEPRGHSSRGRYAFGYNNNQDPARAGGASPYHWMLWGTTVDFGDSTSVNFIPGDDPYWTRDQWKRDPRWVYMGEYFHRRPSNPNATPENPGAWSGDAWNYDLDMTYQAPGIDNPTNFYLNTFVGQPVRYVRWQFIQAWSPESNIMFHEAWFWGGIVSRVESNDVNE
jgi:hypothetical protein